MTLDAAWVLALRVVGVGLAVVGLAHAVLPRMLGWSPTTDFGTDRLSAVVIRAHVGFVGAFLILIGATTAIGADELVRGGLLGSCFAVAAAALFAARWLVEIVAVSAALRGSPDRAIGWRVAHALALVGWPVVVAVYVGAVVVALR